MPGVKLTLYLADGTAEGFRWIEKSNWTGKALDCARSDWPRVREEFADDFQRAGVYVLVGPSDVSPDGTIYIGEADLLLARLDQHHRTKDFWTRFVAFASKDDNLNKAGVKYLESRLVQLARAAKTANVENGNEPSLPKLSRPDTTEAEAFLGEMLLIYPLLGVRAFETPKERPAQEPVLRLLGKAAQASGRDAPEGFIVYSGSTAAKGTMQSMPEFARALRDRLIDKGVLVDDGDCYRFSQDFAFNSPSTALMVVLARSGNGRVEWKDSTGRALKTVQEEALDVSEKAGAGSSGKAAVLRRRGVAR